MVDKLKINAAKPGIFGKISKVWVIPVAAVTFSLLLAAQQFRNRDVTIRIIFPDASGIEVGKTELKFQKVKVGTVSDVLFTEDLDGIEVLVDIKREIAPLVDEDARFWLVKPEISLSGVRGLDTLLKGDYIHGEWDKIEGNPQRSFLAERNPPLVTSNEVGSEIHLVALNSKSVVAGAPVYLRGIKVGVVKSVDLASNGSTAVIILFVNAPYNKFINTGTRFWNASGVNVSLGTTGLDVQISSVATLVQGGVEFSTTVTGGEPITRETVFDLYRNQKEAEDNLLTDNLRAQVHLSSIFTGNLKGLKVGADVEYHGLKIGSVESISASPDQAGDDGDVLQIVVTYGIQPGRLGLTAISDAEQMLDFLDEAVASNGLRARLISKSILGGLSLELFEEDDGPPAILSRAVGELPIMPSVQTAPETLKVAAESVLKRVANLPIESVAEQVSGLIANVDALVTDDNTKQIPTKVVSLLDEAVRVVKSDEFQAIPKQINSAVAVLNSQLDQFESGQGVDNLVVTLEHFRTVARNAEVTSGKLPEIVDDAGALLVKVRELPFEKLIASTEELLGNVNGLVEGADAQGLPEALTAALRQMELAVKELREGGTTNNINQTLASARSAMASIETAASNLPELIEKLSQLSRTAKVALEGVSPASPIYRKASGAIDDIDRTVDSLNALIVQIKRKPNSLLVGK